MNDNNTQDNQFEALEGHQDPVVSLKLRRYKQLCSYKGGHNTNWSAVGEAIRDLQRDLQKILDGAR